MTKVLVVDDEKLIVKGIRFSLEHDGMEVDCAYSCMVISCSLMLFFQCLTNRLWLNYCYSVSE